MRVLIVARTRMKNDFRCIGAIGMGGTAPPSLRLKRENDTNWPSSKCPFHVGDVFDLLIKQRDSAFLHPPHMEDVLVLDGRRHNHLSGQALINEILKKHVPLEGSPMGLFGGKVVTNPNGKLYVPAAPDPPWFSTMFWVPDKRLAYSECEDAWGLHRHYQYENVKLAYVGEQNPVPVLTAGTLVRVSLARPLGERKECYLQVSGWFVSDE